MILEPLGIVRPEGEALVTLEVFEEDGKLVCGIYQLDGRINAGPKAWLGIIREEIGRLERIAKAAGCHEMRVAGRNWSRVLTDYEPFEGPKNGLRKGLL